MARSQLARNELQIQIPPPVGGLNLATSIDKLQPHEAVHLRGYEFDEYGTLGAPRAPKSLGIIQSGAKVLSAHLFQRTGGSTQLIVHLDDGSLRFSTDFRTTSTTASWTTIATGLSTTAPFAFVTWLDKVWMGNGTDDFRSWDGATQVTFASAPKGKFLTLWRDTLWMGNDNTNPHRVYQCAPGDPTVWPAFNFVDIGKGEGLGITSIFAVETALVVFKPLKTHIIFDPVEYTNRVIDHGKGCLSHFSVVAHNGLVYFVSHMGVCRYLGDGPSQIISVKIGPLFDDLYVFGTSLATQLTDTSEEASIWGYSFENFVGWYLPNNLLSQYIKYFPDLPDQPWLFGTPSDSPVLAGRACVVSVREPGTYQQLYRIADNPAIIKREYGGLTSDAVACEWGSAWFDLDAPMDEKYIDMVQILHRGPIDVSFKKNYDDDETRVIASALDHGEAELQESTIYTDDYARSFQVFVSSSTASEHKQAIGTGVAGIAYVSRFQSAISRIVLHGRKLGMMRR